MYNLKQLETMFIILAQNIVKILACKCMHNFPLHYEEALYQVYAFLPNSISPSLIVPTIPILMSTISGLAVNVQF